MGETCIKILDGEHMFTLKELNELTENFSSSALSFIGWKFIHRGEFNNMFIVFLKSLDANIMVLKMIWKCYFFISKELYLDSATL
jgi:hypothetical protein